MKIGILGSGNMGRSLGTLWAEQGHDVFFGARTQEKGRQIAEQMGHNTQGGTNIEAAEFGDVLLYTIRGVNPAEVLSTTDVLNGKILIDCNNFEIPAEFAYEPITYSLAEILADQAPNAKIVKAFNTMAQEVFELSPQPLDQHNVSVFLAGDDATAKQTVAQLAQEIGFSPLDCGPLRQARLLENLGNFIRLMIIGQGMGSYATLSVQTLPSATQERLGGRQLSNLK
ncbi:nadp oxidoreductase coenzyme f420-dependent [Leptolyngbya sp. Heron Island J]|uniref:NADPH-dependent F420 reductase n=1 Tax=Leptolyngbya sp. Heron Island J TaxID=1385935 RepID=UPI0003B9CEAF|nr:NADPH-dependent F420 reductase [Leptolyngbya sp. Heron Island J]ESA33976.1 nadp oxidoreductase coenzyme f420-dependent [Leptolyngbya sp. Heron Island J]